MSLEAFVWAFKQPVGSSSTKFVLVALADFANPLDGKIFPSIKVICDKTELERKTVMSAIKRLIDLGHLVDTGERAGQNQQVKVYRLNMPLESNSERPRTALDGESPKNGTLQSGGESPKNGTKRVPKTGHGTTR